MRQLLFQKLKIPLDNTPLNEQTILDLIKTALFQTEPAILTVCDWNAVFREAQSQVLTALLYDALQDTAPADIRSRWRHDADRHIAKYLRILYAQDELLKLLSGEGIPVVILKGTAAACYYPKPSGRAMGDVDLLVPQERFQEAARLLSRSGYDAHENVPGARHWGFAKYGIEFELHHHFSYEDIDMEAYIADALPHIETAEVDGLRFPLLPRLANGLVLLVHARRHLQASLGLRQVLDWMLYVHRELDDDFWAAQFQPAARALGIEKLAVVMTRMCQLYMGLSGQITWCAGADEALCDRLLAELFANGNFGRKKGATRKVQWAISRMRRKGLFRYLQYEGEQNWRFLQRAPFLRPFAWLYQCFCLLYRGLKMNGSAAQLRQEAACGVRHEALMEDLEIGRSEGLPRPVRGRLRLHDPFL